MEKRGSKPPYRKKEKRQPDKRLYSVANGSLMNLSSVDDMVFARKLYGDGIAIKPSGDMIVSPCNGTVVMIGLNKHSIGIENEAGDHILIHVGPDEAPTLQKGFDPQVTEGTRVKTGQPILKLDRRYLDAVNFDTTTCVVITSVKSGDFTILEGDQAVAGKTPIMQKRNA